MRIAAVMVAALFVGTPPSATGEPDVIATFEGGELNLAGGWAEAHACYSDDGGTRCYRSEHEMDGAERERAAGWQRVEATCSSTLRLYTGTSFTGNVLALNQRSVAIGLSGYGFSDVTSSYKVGACSSTFYDGGFGSTSYPGNTSAGASATSMLSGWDNRVSTAYIS